MFHHSFDLVRLLDHAAREAAQFPVRSDDGRVLDADAEALLRDVDAPRTEGAEVGSSIALRSLRIMLAPLCVSE
jgi:hypothetical protein